ncbi:PA14 domain-containing protein [Pedobacter sp. PWIIR3]
MGYNFIRRHAKPVAYLLLFNISLSSILPLSAYALTSGPAQPESQSFQPAGTSDMVDLLSGDFKYNIPLIDVDGYPLNLNYQSGVGMDDEASWVGLGWNLNVGSINRQVRGVPDDFSGDSLTTTHYTKPKITVGGKVTAKIETRGKARLNGSFTFGVFSDNYTGIGAELGVNAGMSYSFANSGLLTSSMGIGVLSNTSSGVDISPNVSLSITEQAKSKSTVNAGLSSSLGYNSRSGLKSLTLGASFSSYKISTPAISYNTEPIYPKVQIPYFSDYESFSLDVGAAVFGVFAGVGGTGYKSTRRVENTESINKEYGFLYAERGKDNPKGVQDFIREKENPIINELPNLAIPVHTPDIFTYNSQGGSGQFRLYRDGTGVCADNEVSDKSNVKTSGLDIGFGAYGHGGVTEFKQTTTNTTRKWKSNNNYLKKGEFQDSSKVNPLYENVYFRKVDDRGISENGVAGTNILSVNLKGKTADSSFVTNTNYFTNSNILITEPIIKKKRQERRTSISFLTASEAKVAALDKTIKTYAFIDSASFNTFLQSTPVPDVSSRVDGVKKSHHISEITVAGDNNSRMVYGIPVYNKKQEEYSFALGRMNVSADTSMVNTNLAILKTGAGDIGYKKGIDEYYHKELQPGYASSYLLTAMLSPDYADKTGDGVTNDDMGTAIKFNYSKIDTYKWRTPYSGRKPGQTTLTRTAVLNRGLLADPDDDKGSIVYGEKEIYYPHSIESKTQIAYFITADRLDGLGVVDFRGDRDNNAKQRVLKEIRLYSKADKTKPIKIVKFAYSYELCKITPNSRGGLNNAADDTGVVNGKLTLKRVWFEYGNSPKGKEHPYLFTYNNKGASANDVNYTSMATDRWGTFKAASVNPGSLTNEEYPYSSQNKTIADQNAALYHLTKIELPTGGIIDVTYEADSYAYVQNKRAAVMTPVTAMIASPAANQLENAIGLQIALDSVPSSGFNNAQQTEWFKKTYLSGSSYIYTKLYTEIGTDNRLSYGQNWDFISTYCRVDSVKISANVASIFFERISESNVTENPIRFSAWQKMKNEYPRYAYPGFLNRVNSSTGGSTAKAAVSAIVDAAKNLSELKENFYVKAKRKKFANNIDLTKSFVRISKISGYKVGGGVRVRKIQISDNWQNFTGDAQATPGIYGQSYDYTTLEGTRKISSGVASYEPPVGNDENPFKQPVPYVQRIKGAINNYFELEEPFGESFFPSPSVVYSKVTVRDLEANGAEVSNPATGSVSNEFYTAKDFPVRVQVMPIQKYNPKLASNYSLVSTNSIEEMVLSQGYSIETNDMHGKPKAVRIFNQAGSEISSTVYQYSVENPSAAELRLNNTVNVVQRDGTVVNNVTLGRDIEFFTDFREQESKNTGQAINIGFDLIPIWGFPIPIPHWPVSGNNEYKLFRSACAVKVIQNYGIVSSVIKTENGSSITTENLVYDGVTGDAVVTKTQNEFNKFYYTTNIPAYWIYPYMGGAYQNVGLILKDLTLNGSFEINSSWNSIVNEGDELISIANGTRYWVKAKSTARILISVNGELVTTLAAGPYKIVRSSFKNLLGASAGSVVSLNNPIVSNKLQVTANTDIGSALKVISAAATLYDDEWGVRPDCDLPGPTMVENTAYCFSFSGGSLNSLYSSLGSRIQEFPTSTVVTRISKFLGGDACVDGLLRTAPSLKQDTTSLKAKSIQGGMTTDAINTSVCSRPDVPNAITSYSCWPLNRSGIWLSIPIASNLDEWIGFEKCVDFPESKYYYFGFGADNGMKVYVDNLSTAQWELANNSADSYSYWTIKPLYLTAGRHTIRVEFTNKFVAGQDNTNNAGAAGLEIYNNTYQELLNHLPYTQDNGLLFTTKELRGASALSFRSLTDQPPTSYTYHYTYPDGSKVEDCNIPGKPINPYLQGFKGNWRPSESKVYQGSRSYDDIFGAGKRGIGVDDAGYLKAFTPYWYNPGSSAPWTVNTANNLWVTANTVTLYDKYGQELENRDALNRYSAAKFEFNGELPSAVASNAMNREIFENSFEFSGQPVTSQDNCNVREFALNGARLSSYASTNFSHTGNYSAILPLAGVKLTTIRHTFEHKKGSPYLGNLSAKNYYLLSTPGLAPNGFEPQPTGKYTFNAWVYDGHATDRVLDLNLFVKGSGGMMALVPLSCKAVVEGWKLVEGVIDCTAVPGSVFELILNPNNAAVYVDDIRIHPVAAHLKTYAYDNKTLKLMAELDENCFATFYEYDDQGSLIRVKKETERGIITLKESRSSYRKKQ